jgi:hypothetical protein
VQGDKGSTVLDSKSPVGMIIAGPSLVSNATSSQISALR